MSRANVRPVPNEESVKMELVHPALRTWERVTIGGTAVLVIAMLALMGMLFVTMSQLRKDVSTLQQTSKQQLRDLTNEMVSVKAAVSAGMGEDIIFLKILVLNPRIKTPLAHEIAKAVHENSLRFNRDPDLVLSIIDVESNFNPKAVSHAGAIGVMQVMPKWQNILGLEGDLNDIETNIRHGLQIFAFYEETHGGDLELTLSAYNRGPGRVNADLRNGMNPSRNGYAASVRKVYDRLKTFGRK